MRFSIAETSFLTIFDPKWKKTLVNLGDLQGFAHGDAGGQVVTVR